MISVRLSFFLYWDEDFWWKWRVALFVLYGIVLK